MIVLDRNGEFMRSWGEGFHGGRAHGVTFSPDGFVYAIENTPHSIEKYTRDGDLV